MLLELVPEQGMIILGRLGLAALLGGLVGLERDMHGRAAGLRTNLLVCLGSAVFMTLSWLIPAAVGGAADPARIAAQIVTGIGFLGAGAIIKEGINVRGLTTAACLWMVASIGMAAGAGYAELALAATLITLVCLIGFKYLERFYSKDSYRRLSVRVPNSVDPSLIVRILKTKKLKIIYFDIDRNYDSGITTVMLSIRLHHRGITDKVIHGIIGTLEEAGIPLREISWDHK